LSLSEARVKTYYDKYIANDLVYSLPELFSSDIVSIPKKLTGVREYRFFSCYSMILYNAVGLLFVDCCAQFIEQLNFKRKNVFAYYPTKFIQDKNNWTVRTDYKDEYKNFKETLAKQVKPGNVILTLDIESYFETIVHSNLVGILKNYSPESALEKHDYSTDSHVIIEFYLESLMARKFGIPQGKKNFVSDYFGYIYLIPLDIEIPKLASSDSLQFKSMVRYVDDIHIVFNAKNIKNSRIIYKELLTIEQSIAGWLYTNLKLTLNSNKVSREIIKTKKEQSEFIIVSTKTISSPIIFREEREPEEKKKGAEELKKRFIEFKTALNKFRYPEGDKFLLDIADQDKEAIKAIFDRSFQKFLFESSISKELRQTLDKMDIELTAEHVTMIIAIFLMKKENNQPFLPIFEKFLFNALNLDDKRHIHILLAAISQDLVLKKVKRSVEKNRQLLLSDNYGKYVLPFFSSITVKSDFIYSRIYREYLKQKVKQGTFLYNQNPLYEKVIEYIIRKYPDQQTLIQPLKNYVYEKSGKRWDTAFNHFHSFFHEICKIKFKLPDKSSSNVKKIIEKLDNLGIDEELLIMKFYDRRNFNPISHPSQKGKPSIKVSEGDLTYYVEKILSVIEKHLLN